MRTQRQTKRFKPGDLIHVPANVTLLKFRSPVGDPQRDIEMRDLNEHPVLAQGPPIAIKTNEKPKHALVVAYDDTTRRCEIAVDGSTWSVHRMIVTVWSKYVCAVL